MGNWVNRKEEARFLRKKKPPGFFLFDFCQDLIIVQDYCDGGDLAHYIFFKKKNNELVPETNIIQWSPGMLGSFGFLVGCVELLSFGMY